MRPSVESIKERVAAEFRVPVADLVGPRRLDDHAVPRHVAMYLAGELTPNSRAVIGRLFGGRHPSTVLYSQRKVARRRQVDFPFAVRVARVRIQLVSPVKGSPDGLDQTR